MARRKKKTQSTSAGVSEAVSMAINGASELCEELQTWFDGLHENFQNGSKGETLQAAIDTLENVSEPDVPDLVSTCDVSYVECIDRKASRSDRLGNCISMMQGAAQAARELIDGLDAFKYDSEGNLSEDDQVSNPDAPATEDERDSAVSDLEAFADECDGIVSEWEGVEFPGMYG